MNRYVGLLHAQITSTATEGMGLNVEFPEDCGLYFENHTSRWHLWLSDAVRDNLKSLGELSVQIDGKASKKSTATDLNAEELDLELPQGLGPHHWELSPATNEKK